MEVHKHPHHVTHKKKWSEYLVEFLMLFLAVFLGFLAENWREHLVDTRKEKEYMFSLVQDVKADTAEINKTIVLGTRVAAKLDSLAEMLNSEDPRQNTENLYFLSATSSRVVAVGFEDRTATQLKNSGNLRLVRNKNVSDSIRKYFSSVNNDQAIAARMEELQIRGSDIRDQVFNNKYYQKRTLSNPFNTNGNVKDNPKLLSDDPELLAQLSNKSVARLGVLYNYLNRLQETKLTGERLINLINKEYQFE